MKISPPSKTTSLGRQLLVSLLLVGSTAQAQSFIEAISAYPQLSNFSSLYNSSVDIASLLIRSESPRTILVPSNDAFTAYQKDKGMSVSSTPSDQMTAQLQYHILVGALSSTQFNSNPLGLTVPTMLTDEQYNNRTVGSALAGANGGVESAKGQVLVINSNGGATTSRKFRVRTQSSLVRSGMASDANLNAVDGTWTGGKFQIIDRFLTLPASCSKTIRGTALTSFDQALNQTKFWPRVDHMMNVTCLGPTNEAFTNAGNPQTSLGTEDLTKVILFHTLTQTLYSSFLYNGQTFDTMSGDKVTITVRNKDVYFNDAKVVNANVLTNNGLMHELDKVMTPNGTAPPASTSTTTASPTSTKVPGMAAGPMAASTGLFGLTGLSGLLMLLA